MVDSGYDVVVGGRTAHRWGDPPAEEPQVRSFLDSGYWSAVGRSRILLALFGCWVVVSSVAAAASIASFRVADRLIRDPLSISVEAVQSSDARQFAMLVIWFIGYLVTGAAFIYWMLRVYDNTRPLGRPSGRYSRGWAIGGWFVPILNLWRPKQVMDDLWTASDPGPEDSPPPALQVRPTLTLLHVWWALFIIGGFLGEAVSGIAQGATFESARTAAAVDVVLDLVFVGSAIAAGLVVWFTTQRQDAWAEVRFIDFHRPARVVTFKTAMRIAALAAIVAVIVTAVAAVAFDPPVSEPRAIDPAEVESGVTPALGVPTALSDLEPTDCWYSADVMAPNVSSILAVEGVPCGEPHHGELYAREAHPASQSAPYPGEEILFVESFALCAEAFPAAIGTSYESSTFDIFSIVPDREAWQVGDRSVSCSVTSIDGTLLSRPAAAIDDVLPGTDSAVLAATTCDELTTVTLDTVQMMVVTFESMSAAELSAVGPNEIAPGMERTVKRVSLIVGMAHRLECPLSQLDASLAARSAELEANTPDGRDLIQMFVDEGFFE